MSARSIEHAGAPRGSFQHYFPGGKDQLVGEAARWAGDFAVASVRSYREQTRRPTPAGLFAHIIGRWERDFERHGYARGCPVMATMADLGASDSTAATDIRAAISGWHSKLAEELVAMDVPEVRSRRLATLMISTLEGAIMLSRAQQSVEPFRDVVTELTPLLGDAGTQSV